MKLGKGSIIILALLVVAFVFVASSMVTYTEKHQVHDRGYRDLNNKIVDTPELPTEASPEKVKKMDIKDTKMYLSIPSVGLHNRVKRMSALKGESLYPPGFRNTYLLRGYGTPKKKHSGTTYLVTHAIKNGLAPGNYLISMGRQKIVVHKGAKVKVDGVSYHVTQRKIMSKSDLPYDDVWKQDDDKLAIITCMQRLNGIATENAVIVAERDKSVKPKPKPTATPTAPTPSPSPTKHP